ncbi:MAG TPA: DUF4338 domain-containing protein [Smithellaceae bacterium]|jgi:hypothetical protein|nr:DUF4338 domain-containing protein [Smithellaceae bacterium]
MTAADASEHEIQDLRDKVIASLKNQGFILDGGRITLPENLAKEGLRRLHTEAVKTRREKSRKGLASHEQRLLTYIANGTDVQPDKIKPRLVEVKPETENELLFRYASHHWSIPVSSGYGRRLRFLVFDDYNGKLIGLFGLGDPVFSLAARDHWIGWDKEQRRTKLRHVMDAFLLGAIPPYSSLLCGKLVAMLVASNEVRDAFRRKYRNSTSVIKQEASDGRLVLITTTSALGRSSIYNRMDFDGRKIFYPLGYTAGSGEFHFSNGLYADFTDFARRHCQPTAKQSSWGTGFRNRRELVRKVLKFIGLPGELIYHRVNRQVFVIPLARNTKEFLNGRHRRVQWYNMPAERIFNYFKERWLLGRAERDKRYLDFKVSSYALWMKQAETGEYDVR